MDSEINFLFKVVVIGDSGVGKSNLMTRYTCDEFNLETPATIGVEFMTKVLNIEGREVRAQIWDTAGQERFRALGRAIYQGAKGAMIVYDITNQSSFNNIGTWVEELRRHADPPPVMMLIGNKSDLEHLRVVKQDVANAFAQEHGLSFMETSALESTNVEKSFEWLLSEVLKRQLQGNVLSHSQGGNAGSDKATRAPPAAVSTVRLEQRANTEKKKKGCC